MKMHAKTFPYTRHVLIRQPQGTYQLLPNTRRVIEGGQNRGVILMEEADPDARRGTADDGRVGVRPLEVEDAYELLGTPCQDLLPTLQQKVCE